MSEIKKPFLSGKKRKTVGVILIVGPFVTLFAVIILWAIIEFAVSASLSAQSYSFTSVAHAQTSGQLEVVPYNGATLAEQDSFGSSTLANVSNDDGLEGLDLGQTIASLIRVVLSFVGILSLLGIFIGVPAGAYLLATKHPSERNSSKHPSPSSPQGTPPDKSPQEPPAQPRS